MTCAIEQSLSDYIGGLDRDDVISEEIYRVAKGIERTNSFKVARKVAEQIIDNGDYVPLIKLIIKHEGEMPPFMIDVTSDIIAGCADDLGSVAQVVLSFVVIPSSTGILDIISKAAHQLACEEVNH